MITRKILQFLISGIRWIYGFKILGLLITLTTPFLLLFLSPGAVHAEVMFYMQGGFGDSEIKTKHDGYKSVSKNSRRHLDLGMNLEKEGYPLSVSFNWGFFETEEAAEKWTIDPVHENRLALNGGTFDVKAFVTPYTYSSKKGRIRVTPFLGGGLGYKRFKFERKGLNENLLTDPNAVQILYLLGNQAVTTIGVTPHMGIFLDLPELEAGCNLYIGWSFLAVKSNLDYHVFSKGDEVINPVTIHTSGSSLVTGIEIVKGWDSFSVALGFIWEKTQIDDKAFLYDHDKDGEPEKVFIFPELEIVQAFGKISLNYLF